MAVWGSGSDASQVYICYRWVQSHRPYTDTVLLSGYTSSPARPQGGTRMLEIHIYFLTLKFKLFFIKIKSTTVKNAALFLTLQNLKEILLSKIMMFNILRNINNRQYQETNTLNCLLLEQ